MGATGGGIRTGKHGRARDREEIGVREPEDAHESITRILQQEVIDKDRNGMVPNFIAGQRQWGKSAWSETPGNRKRKGNYKEMDQIHHMKVEEIDAHWV